MQNKIHQREKQETRDESERTKRQTTETVNKTKREREKKRGQRL